MTYAPTRRHSYAEMLYIALAWNPNSGCLRQAPFCSAFRSSRCSTRGGVAPVTRALVAEDAGQRIGLVWYRLFTEAVHGEGFVDEETPEVAIAVLEGRRASGVGTALMEAIHARATRERSSCAISLSVDRENPARRLYERLGYVDVEPDDENGRMILELA